MKLPPIVSSEEWQAAHGKLLVKEKEATRARDALAAERRRQPMVLIEKDYVFEGPAGKSTLLDLFDGRSQLLLYHFMFAPGVDGWPSAGCPGCSFFVDQVGHLAHLHERDTSFVLVSLAPLPNIEAYKRRMGWSIPWLSSHGTDFTETLASPRTRARPSVSAFSFATGKRSIAPTSRPLAGSRRLAPPGPSST